MKNEITGYCPPKYWNTSKCGMKNPQQCAHHALRGVRAAEPAEDRVDQERARVADSWFSLSLH
jgi:hypothetical protein